MIIDHQCVDLGQVPLEWINAVRANLRVWYGHTSHGSQPISGMEVFNAPPYHFSPGGDSGGLSLQEDGGVDLGHNGDLAWADRTREVLNAAGNDRNVIVWSWCGGASDNTVEGINAYLNAMNTLESQYPGARFVYMTGHLDGTGLEGGLHRSNEQIRAYCRANNKVLFDFADLESYDPAGREVLSLYADDNCDYWDGPTHRNWAADWCAAHPADCSTCECAHSQSLNCDR